MLMKRFTKQKAWGAIKSLFNALSTAKLFYKPRLAGKAHVPYIAKSNMGDNKHASI